MKCRATSRSSSELGAVLVEYTLTVLLIAVVALAGTRYLGTEVKETFVATGGTITSMSNGPTYEGGVGAPGSY